MYTLKNLAAHVRVCASITSLIVCSGHANAASTLALQDVPLFLSTGAEPNLMIMLDNSGSMGNIVPDSPYDPNTTYISSCPSTYQASTTSEIYLKVVSSTSPGFQYGGSGTTYTLGTSGSTSTVRCFVSSTVYLARLQVSVASGALYTGNYLNWYFSSASGPTPCSDTWSTKNRKPCTQSRMEIAKTAASNLVNSMSSNMRVGLATYNAANNGDGGSLLEQIAVLDSSQKSSIKTKIAAMSPTGYTPLAETLQDIGSYFAMGYTGNLTLHPRATTPTTDTVTNVFGSHTIKNDTGETLVNPIQYSCQKSFAVLLTDGRPNNDRNISSDLRDYSGDCAVGNQCDSTPTTAPPNLPTTAIPDKTYKNGTKVGRTYELIGSDYLDDVAMGLFEMDLRPDLEDTLGSKNNLVTYLIGFADPLLVNDPLLTDTGTRGGGDYLTAGNEAELNDAFSSAFAGIVQKTASASSASVNSGSISSDTKIFQAKFNSATWTGQLLAYPINANGTIGSLSWDASDQLPAASSRQIVTVNSDNSAVSFTSSTLDTTRLAQLDSNATIAANLVNYLRGDTTNEGTATGKFRRRADASGPNQLGDIVSSSPLFVGKPPFRYSDSMESSAYSTFATSKASRTGMVYAGANDGMLHGFNASTGAEVFGFVPSAVFGRLKNLASQTYSHEFFVDGPTSMGDVFFGSAWHTALVGGLNKGGQEIYALDITNPATLGTAESNPGSVVLWEFLDHDDTSKTGIQGDADLGLTFSQPVIAKMRNGKWAAIFGNGYNSRISDGNQGSGNAVLYVVDIQTGTLIKKFDTKTGPSGSGAFGPPNGVTWDNGMSTPAVVDTNGDRVVEYAYAGDLYGNMWKFDLSSTDSTNWKMAYGTTAAPEPLFRTRDGSTSTANAQPITVRPEVTRGPGGNGMMVLFGTGKYLETADKTTTGIQTFYGILDRNTGTAATDEVASDRSTLQQQSILNELSVDPDGSGPLTTMKVRVTSNNALGTKSGWYMDLKQPPSGTAQGERQVTNPIVRSGNVVFTTMIPDATPCGAGGTSWIMEINALSGSRGSTTPFDLNRDGDFTNADFVNPGTGAVPASGIGSSEGILQSPGVVEGQTGSSTGGGACVQYKYMPGSSGGIQQISENCGPGGTGRQSWRQIR